MGTEEDVPRKNAEIAKGQAERVAERDGSDPAPIDALSRQSPERDGRESQLRPPKAGR